MRFTVAVCTVLLLGITVADTPVRTQSLEKLDPQLQQRAAHPLGHSQVLVKPMTAAIDLLIQQVGGTLGRALPLVNARVADVPDTSLAILAASVAVQRVALDRLTFGTLERTGATIGAAAVRQQLGYDGHGIGVAVIDSGITSWHDDLTDPAVLGSQRVARFVDFVGNHTLPYDDYGHGTHVAGIVAGNGTDSSGHRAGVAPAASLIVLKVLDGSGGGHISDVIAALDYAIDNKTLLNIRVINLSIGAGVYESYNADLLAQAAKCAVDQGIVVVAAAGNNGRNAQGQTQYGGITSPANAPWVLTVGASSHMGTVDRADDTVASFSSRGPTYIDYGAKPDLVAPGVGIESLTEPTSSLYSRLSAYLLNGTIPKPYAPYLSLTGTSMATPVVSGTVALMLQANPALTPNAVKAILQYTAQVYPNYNALTEGAGFLNALGAVQLARFFGDPSGSYPSTAGWSGHVVWGNHRVFGGRLMPGVNAWNASTTWGSSTASNGDYVAWGTICSTSNCEPGGGGVWTAWRAHCTDVTCTTVAWGDGGSDNVVWGSQCAGSDCTAVWSTGSEGDGVVWGSSGDCDGVVWGSSEGDGVVWGSGCQNGGCDPILWSSH